MRGVRNEAMENAHMNSMDHEPGRLLIDCLSRAGWGIDATRLDSLSTAGWQDIIALATTQRVLSLLWHRLKQRGAAEAVPKDVAELMRQFERRNTMHNLLYYRELRLLTSALQSENIPVILLKGIYLADAVYENIGLRQMNDIDLMVHPADLARVFETLEGMGYSTAHPVSTDLALKTSKHLPTMLKPGRAGFEIHWNITPPGKSYTIGHGGLWDRAAPVRVAGCDALALAPEDLLLHLCIHTSYQHQFAFGLRPTVDIAETIGRFETVLDWEAVAARAIDYGWQRGVYLALRLTTELAGTEVPGAIMAKLRPADMPEIVLESARAQILTDARFAATMPVFLARILKAGRLRDKLRIFRERVFLPRPMMAAHYSIPAGSAKVYLCYPHRFFDVLLRHGGTLRKFRENDHSLANLAARKTCIAGWLDEAPGTRNG